MKRLSIIFCLIIFCSGAKGQDQNAEPTNFSLNQAIDYGLIENFSIKNSSLQSELTTAQKGEARSNLLPQISANADLVHSFDVQKNITESGIGFQQNSTLPKGTPIAFQLGLRNVFTPNVFGSQVLYDQSSGKDES